MVTADNLNFDVLTLVLSFLGNYDLVSACLVSQSFRASATPLLYRKVSFRLDQMKKWPKVRSPFDTLVEHPTLATHVRHCEIKYMPKVKGQPHPTFIASCVKGIKHCRNLTAFTCLMHVGSFLPFLSSMTRLSDLKISAALNLQQTKALPKITRLRSVSLLDASLAVCHAMITWIPTMVTTLTNVTVSNSRDFNERVLESIVYSLPNLQGLHITGCAKISHQAVLRLVNSNRQLISLSVTTWENASTDLPEPLSLPSLRHFSIDTRNSFSQQAIPTLYLAIFGALSTSPLKAITIKLSEAMIMADPFIFQLVGAHQGTLTRFNCVNVDLTILSLESMSRACSFLEQLSLPIPKRSDHLDEFIEALSLSDSLKTVVDINEAHTTHGPQSFLTASDIKELFRRTKLSKIISGNRSWTCERIPIYQRKRSMCLCGMHHFSDDDEDEDDEYDEEYDDEDDLDYATLKTQTGDSRKVWDWDIKLHLEQLRLSRNPAQTLVSNEGY